MQEVIQRPHRQPISADFCVMLQQQHFDGSNPAVARNYRAEFKEYVTFQTRQGSINTLDIFKNMFY